MCTIVKLYIYVMLQNSGKRKSKSTLLHVQRTAELKRQRLKSIITKDNKHLILHSLKDKLFQILLPLLLNLKSGIND